MKQNIILPLILTVLIGAGGYYYVSQRNMQDAQVSSTENDSRVDEDNMRKPDDDKSFVGSFMDLLSSTDTMMCTWEAEDEDSTVSGITYVDGQRIAGEFAVASNSQNVVSNMVGDGETLYVWINADGATTGYMMDYAQMKASAETMMDATPASGDTQDTTNPANLAQDLAADYEYNCEDWTVDESKFEIPTEVEFLNLSTMLQNLQQDSGALMEQYKNYMDQQ